MSGMSAKCGLFRILRNPSSPICPFPGKGHDSNDVPLEADNTKYHDSTDVPLAADVTEDHDSTNKPLAAADTTIPHDSRFALCG